MARKRIRKIRKQRHRKLSSLRRSEVVEDRVQALQLKFSEKDFDFVFEKTRSIYYKVVRKFFGSNIENLDEALSQDKSFVWQIIKDYDRKKSLFSTYLYNKTFYFLCHTYSRKGRKEILQSSLSEESCFFTENEEAVHQYENMLLFENNLEMYKSLMEEIENFPDERVKKIIDIRYFSGYNKPVTFKKIAETMGKITPQSVFLIFKKFCEHMQKKY